MADGSGGAEMPNPANMAESVSLSVIEQRVDHLLACIQPNAPSELRRLTIASYVCDLIRRCFASQRQVEAFMFGSVPLRTYLPDGDIDISMFFPLHGPNDPLKDTWGTQLLKALEREAGRRDAPFRIRNCQIIQAEFKLVKFVVADVVVDVSFNALGGLCTVAFLEWADRTIGRNHLFKRSIVLVKAWCYYESRLLGAHHGLISSYALEAMVFYVFNLHGASLQSPLQVLHCFLREFGAFEWEKYALSLLGPVRLEALPHLELAKEAMPEGPSLFDPVELRDAVQRYSVQPAAAVAAVDALLASSRAADNSSFGAADGGDDSNNSEQFTVALPQKLLNIIDPLLPNNNLGRSVSKASFSRIRRALAFGAEQLERILKMEPLAASEGIAAYFENTWRSPTRMAADNQIFQSRLAQSGGSLMFGGNGAGGSRRRQHSGGAMPAMPAAYAGMNGAMLLVPGVQFHRSVSNQSINDTGSDVSTSTAGEREDAGIAAAAPAVVAPVAVLGAPPPMPPPLQEAAPAQNGTPVVTPRSQNDSVDAAAGRAPGTESVSIASPPAPQAGAYVSMLPSATFAAPVTTSDGKRTLHASLPGSPAMAAPVVAALPPSPLAAGPISRDIFMSDLDTVLANLNLAREWQPQSNNNSNGSAAPTAIVGTQNNAGQNKSTNSAVSATGNGRKNTRSSSDSRSHAASGPQSPRGAAVHAAQALNVADLEAAMAALPPVRVSSAAVNSYASVTAQGLTPLTATNSLDVSFEVSAAPSREVSAPPSAAISRTTSLVGVSNSPSAAASPSSSTANTPRAGASQRAASASSAGVRSSAAAGAGISGDSPRQYQMTTAAATAKVPIQPPQQQLPSARPPLPGKASASNSTASTPRASATIPPIMPKMPWGRGYPGSSTAVTPPSPGASPHAPRSVSPLSGGGGGPGSSSSSLAPAGDSPRASGSSPTASTALVRNSWSSVAGRQPSRLGQMHASVSSSSLNGIPREATSGPSSTNASTPCASPPPGKLSAVEAAAPAVPAPTDSEAWPAMMKVSKPLTIAAPKNSIAGSSSTQTVWGSLPRSVKSSGAGGTSIGIGSASGNSTPAGVSPRVGSWAAAAALSPKKASVSKKAPASPKAATPVSAKGQASAAQPNFSLKKDDFPSLG